MFHGYREILTKFRNKIVVYKTLLTTSNKKSYAGMFTAKLGKKLARPKLDMKGLQISKANSPKVLRQRFQSLLVDKILMPKNVNLLEILDEFDNISDNIQKSLSAGYLEYATPKNIGAIESYEIPERMDTVRGMLIWNALEPNKQLTTPNRCKMLKLNCTSDLDPKLLALKETHPDKYDAIIKTVYESDGTNGTMNLRNFGFTCISIPLDVEKIPDYLIPFINIELMIGDNVKNANILLKSLGTLCSTNSKTKIENRSSVCLLDM